MIEKKKRCPKCDRRTLTIYNSVSYCEKCGYENNPYTDIETINWN